MTLERISEALYQSVCNTIEHHGTDKCLFLTLTAPKWESVGSLKKKAASFLSSTKTLFPHAWAVMGLSKRATHVHFVVFHNGKKTSTAINRAVREARTRAGFSHVLDIGPLRNPKEHVSRYMASNFLSTARSRRKTGRLYLYRGISPKLIFKPTYISALTKRSKSFRASMTRLANMAGTPVGDYGALEKALLVRQDIVRKVIFGLGKRLPCKPGCALSELALAVAFPALRNLLPRNHPAIENLASGKEFLCDLAADMYEEAGGNIEVEDPPVIGAFQCRRSPELPALRGQELGPVRALAVSSPAVRRPRSSGGTGLVERSVPVRYLGWRSGIGSRSRLARKHCLTRQTGDGDALKEGGIRLRNSYSHEEMAGFCLGASP